MKPSTDFHADLEAQLLAAARARAAGTLSPRRPAIVRPLLVAAVSVAAAVALVVWVGSGIRVGEDEAAAPSQPPALAPALTCVPSELAERYPLLARPATDRDRLEPAALPGPLGETAERSGIRRVSSGSLGTLPVYVVPVKGEDCDAPLGATPPKGAGLCLLVDPESGPGPTPCFFEELLTRPRTEVGRSLDPDRLLVLGLAPPEATCVVVTLEDGEEIVVASDGGVIAGRLPVGARPDPDTDLRFQNEAGDTVR